MSKIKYVFKITILESGILKYIKLLLFLEKNGTYIEKII